MDRGSAGPNGTDPHGAGSEVTVVSTPGCHLCADAFAALAEFAGGYPIRVSLVEAAGEAGRALVAIHRPSMFPLVLVDGAFFSQGRLPRRKLLALLGSRPPAGTR